MLERLHALDDARGEVLVGGDACGGGLLDDRAPAGELGDEHVAAVADDRRVDVLEGLGVRPHARGVQARLVREGVLAHVGLGGVGHAVEQLVHEVRRLGQARQVLGREQRHAHLQLQVRDYRDEVRIARALADAVDRALHVRGARFHRGERVGDRAAGVVVGVDAEREAGQRFAHDRERGADLRRQRAAVGVAQHDALGARLGGRAQAVERVAGVQREAVEEVLRVEQHALARAGEERDGLGDHREVLLTRDAHDLLHVQHRGLAHDRAHRREALREHPQPLVLRRGHLAPAGHAEGHHLRARELHLGEQREQLLLLRVRGREARLDHVHAELVERADDAQLLLRGQAHAAAAHAVAQGGVV